jgi:hypothetical protein
MINKVTIVGGGFGGWYTAAAFKHNYPDIHVTVIDSDKHPRLGVGETLGWSAPYDWRRQLGLADDHELMARTGAIYKYGLTVSDFWNNNQSSSYGKFFNIKISSLAKFYGEYDYPEFMEPWSQQPGDVGVQQAWLAINQHTDKNFDDYIAEINEASHFIRNPVAPYDYLNRYVLRPGEGWSYHIDAEQMVGFLKDLAFKDNPNFNVAKRMRETREAAMRSLAPTRFGLSDQVQNAVLSGPSRAALNATDVSTMSGSQELTRLLRGDDANKNQDLLAINKEQLAQLEAIAEATRAQGVAP